MQLPNDIWRIILTYSHPYHGRNLVQINKQLFALSKNKSLLSHITKVWLFPFATISEIFTYKYLNFAYISKYACYYNPLLNISNGKFNPISLYANASMRRQSESECISYIRNKLAMGITFDVDKSRREFVAIIMIAYKFQHHNILQILTDILNMNDYTSDEMLGNELNNGIWIKLGLLNLVLIIRKLPISQNYDDIYGSEFYINTTEVIVRDILSINIGINPVELFSIIYSFYSHTDSYEFNNLINGFQRNEYNEYISNSGGFAYCISNLLSDKEASDLISHLSGSRIQITNPKSDISSIITKVPALSHLWNSRDKINEKLYFSFRPELLIINKNVPLYDIIATENFILLAIHKFPNGSSGNLIRNFLNVIGYNPSVVKIAKQLNMSPDADSLRLKSMTNIC